MLHSNGKAGVPRDAMRGGASWDVAMAGPGALTARSIAAARDVLAKADAVIVANQEDLRKAVQNLTTFTDVLAKNSDNIDSILKNTKDATASAKDLMENVDKRTEEMSKNFNTLMKTSTTQVQIIGKSVSDLAKNPSRILFGGGGR